jgi:hypothetical protein
MSKKVKFNLSEDHVKLIRKMKIRWSDGPYGGSPEVDPKRPFGGNEVTNDMAEIIGIEKVKRHDGKADYPSRTYDRCMRLYRELDRALQAVLVAGSFEPGIYEADEGQVNWERAEGGNQMGEDR